MLKIWRLSTLLASLVLWLQLSAKVEAQVAQPCGGTITQQSGIIISPNYPNGYPNNTNCYWSITAAKNQIIDIRFDSLDLERYSDNNCYDVFQAFDGPSSSSPVISDGPTPNEPVWAGRYCGFTDATKIGKILIRSSSNQISMYFSSDNSGSRPGFRITYNAHECPPWTYGEEACTTPCICDKTNTAFCVSKNGTCNCNKGWTSSDCSKDINECRNPNTCLDLYSDCKNTLGSFECNCKPGLTQNSIGACEDSKVCKQKVCSHACVLTSSTPPEEQCICPKGMRLNPSDNLTCVTCDDWTYGDNCAYKCGCNKKNTDYCDKRNGLCFCYLNWTNTNCTDDVNECGLIKPPCDTTTTSCYNIQGSFECHCLRGFEKFNFNETSCQACGRVITDKSGTINSYNYSSYGPRGGYEDCNFTIVGGPSEVVSFKFLTFDVFYTYDMNEPISVSFYDGRNSSAKLIQKFFADPLRKPPNGIIRSSGNEMFIVRNGTYWGVNYLMKGFSSVYWVHECPAFMYDGNCTTPCICVQENTKYCNNTNGTCFCKDGWRGDNCSQDIDECYENPLSCPDYSNCKNLNGSFECTCKLGLVMNAEGKCVLQGSSGGGGGGGGGSGCTRSCSHVCVRVTPPGQSSLTDLCYCPIGMELEGDKCVDCKNNRYGPDCYRPCQCVANHTVKCDPRTGNCTCLKEWKGIFCADDVDECKLNTTECKPFSNCTNTIGGYTCNCSKDYGYTESENGTCVPINCSVAFTSATGIIKSPNYGAKLYNNANCSFLITVTPGNVISLRLTNFYIQSSYKCSDNYFAVYDGGDKTARLQGSYCYTGNPGLIRSRRNMMAIYYVTNWNSYTYFYGTYTSHPCDEFTYGDTACDKNCTCVRENTDYCNNVNGLCICKPGFMLRNCSGNVNECQEPNVCPPNSDCIDTIGSYRCECHKGYAFNATARVCDVDSDCVVKKCSHSCYVVKPGVEQCVCPEDLVLGENQLKCVAPLYPYGPAAEDAYLVTKQSNTTYYLGMSSPIYFSSPAPFGDTVQQAAFVVSNGMVTFGGKEVIIAGQASLIISFNNKINCVAPYWANIRGNAGIVYYHLYEKCDGRKYGETDYGWSTNKTDEVMKRAAKDLTKFHDLQGFEPNRVLVTTWEKVKPLGGSSTSNEENTFQAIYISGWEKTIVSGQEILSNEEAAYVIFIYKTIKWMYVPGRQVAIGITSSSGMTNLKDTDTAMVAMLDSVPGNVGFTGVLSYEVGRVSGPQQWCDKYLCTHIHLLADPIYQWELRSLYQCPCTLERLGMQWELFEVRGVNQDIYCYVISARAKRRLLWDNRRNNMCCYRWIKPNNNNWQDWLRTWREATYLPASAESGHVLINDPSSIGYFNNYEAYENIQAHRYCCGDAKSERLCRRFYKIFPDLGCSNWVTFVPASALGDPHICSLDGLTYSMNGWGEFIMIFVRRDNFMLQARTARVQNSTGGYSNATVFVAFAARESNYGSFQVELAPSNTSMNIIADSKDLTGAFYADVNFKYSTDFISIYREYNGNTTVVSIAFSCGMSLKVNVAMKSLEAQFAADKILMNATEGLLGYFDGDPSNDFMYQGTVFPTNMSERNIYHKFAKNYMVTSDNSVFIYDYGKTTKDYQHPEFEPMYKDEADPAKVAEAEKVCGKINDGCIFDYLATNDPNFALYTKDSQDKQNTISKDLENTPPTISVKTGSLNSDNRWVVENGKKATLQLVLADVDKDTVTCQLVQNITNLSITLTGTLVWLPDVTDPVTIRVRAMDSKGAYSPVLTISVTVCPGCSGHGQCDANLTRTEEYESGRFLISVCNCFPAFTGEDCESEIDGCAASPCSRGQNCTDLTAAEQGNNTIAYKCGPCPVGFYDLNGKCADIDECEPTSVSVCDQICMNTEGSYSCSCNDGYRRDVVNKSKCIDINECEERTSRCVQECKNMPGNYTCSCKPGYRLSSDGINCTIDPNNAALCQKCQQVCNVTGAQATCSCNLGYEVDPANSNKCRDIDECKGGKKPCSQDCVNTEGNFECECYTGYQLDTDGTSCVACERPYYGVDCGSICQCNSRGTCNPARGCVCDKEWTGANCEVDVDECTKPDICAAGLVCRNKLGSYECACPNGFRMENGKCQDIDECSLRLMNITCDRSTEKCINNVGSYSCECEDGYARNNSTCEDIDECQRQIDKCGQICENAPGQYNCKCNPGYELGDDRVSCKKVQGNNNICGSLNCSHGCQVVNNKTVCYCPQGYQLSGLEKCTDINECLSDATNLCSYKPGCVNTDRSFTCSCQVGFKLDNDQRSCLECTGGTWGSSCSNSCACGPGAQRCDPKTGCVCKTGFTGTQCNTDIDECKTGQVKCNKNEKCVNVPGSAQCECLDGFEKVSGTCEDIDECGNTTTNTCTQMCNNTVGGYTCSCYSGFVISNTTGLCSDINECETGSFQCQESCINTEGSYRCSCGAGLQLHSDGLKCVSTTPCITNQGCSYLCSSVNGKDTCVCPKGQALSRSDGKTCTDADLCASSGCKFGCMETQKNTSFQCLCPFGTILAEDRITCNECESWKFGLSCSQNCQCNTSTSNSCNKTDGTCLCKSGWMGSNCDTDVNECNSPVCPALSTCTNKPGTYTCDCQAGYFMNSTSKTCQECAVWKFGLSCSQNCQCNTSTSNSCNKTDGTCLCKSGWTGSNCDTDVNECNSPVCPTLSTCTNKPGTYTCDCQAGYFMNSTSKLCQECESWKSGLSCSQNCQCNTSTSNSCNKTDGTCLCKSGWTGSNCDTDVNECNSPTTPACPKLSTCTNKPGTYTCDCQAGYFMNSTSQSCQECASWKSGLSCSQNCQCNTSTSNSCNKTDGTCLCKSGWMGSNCDTDVNECNSPVCPAYSTCTNKPGTYTCDCQVGYFMNSTSKTCQECESWKSGLSCSQNCQCNTSTSNSCNKTDGTCLCKSGWMGSNCDTDVNECNSPTPACPTLSTCTNKPGTYTCDCQAGYFMNSTSKTCQECESWKSGLSCSQNCQCNTSTSNSCNKTDGTCLCKSGWTGSNCDTDVNECNSPTPVCPAYSTCTNKPGTFTCECRDGYKLDSSSKTCKEITTYSVTLIFLIDVLGVDLTNQDGAGYKELKEQIENQIFARLIKRLTTLISVIVTNLRHGSVIADMNVTTEKANGSDPFTLALLQSNNEGNYTINNNTAPAGSTNVNGQNCELKNSEAVCTNDGSNSNDKTDLALGLGLGLPLFIILCAVVAGITYCWVRKNNKRMSESSITSSTDRRKDESEVKSGLDNPYYHFESKYKQADRLNPQWRKGPATTLAATGGGEFPGQPAVSKSGYNFPSYGGSSSDLDIKGFNPARNPRPDY